MKDYDPTAAIERWYGQKKERSDSEVTLIRRNGRRKSRRRTHHADMTIFWILNARIRNIRLLHHNSWLNGVFD